jgi:capreomycidine synthase
MTSMRAIAPARLEDWFRERYFSARIDISSSGVENYAMRDLRQLLGIGIDHLDAIIFRDSPSCGREELTEAIRARVAPETLGQVMVTHGSSEAIFLAMSAQLGPGDEVIVPSPAYQSLTSTVEATGATPVVWELRESEGFVPDPAMLRALLSPRTRMVVVNFPHNPTGATLDPAAYTALVELLADHPAHLLWDGSLSELCYDRPPLPDPTTFLERCISTGTFSKAYGLPGLRIGWCIASPAVIAKMVRLRDYTTLNSSPLTEYLAMMAMRNASALVGPRLDQATVNRALLIEWARAHADLVDCPVPAGGVTAFPRFTGLASTRPLCEWLADVRGVLVVPGDCFGHPGRVRIGFGGMTGEVRAGLAELSAALSDLRSGRRLRLCVR